MIYEFQDLLPLTIINANILRTLVHETCSAIIFIIKLRSSYTTGVISKLLELKSMPKSLGDNDNLIITISTKELHFHCSSM